MKLSLDHVSSPVGTLLLVTSETELFALDFGDFDERMRHLLHRRYGPVELREKRECIGVSSGLDAYFAGDLHALDALPLALGGTAFQQTVWRALRAIPAGTTLSYGALARTIGKPNATRAVGLANGSNPIGIVVPCHRVIGANGTLTGYAGGLPRKRWLLAHEGAELRLW